MATKKEVLQKSQEAIANYFQLSKFLFSEDAPYDVNEIPQDSPFYESAKAISDEMELDWENMSHEDSNRVMLNLLADYYFNIQTDEKYIPVLNISFTKTIIAKEAE